MFWRGGRGRQSGRGGKLPRFNQSHCFKPNQLPQYIRDIENIYAELQTQSENKQTKPTQTTATTRGHNRDGAWEIVTSLNFAEKYNYMWTNVDQNPWKD